MAQVQGTPPKLAERLPELLWHLTFPAPAPSASHAEAPNGEAIVPVALLQSKVQNSPRALSFFSSNHMAIPSQGTESAFTSMHEQQTWSPST